MMCVFLKKILQINASWLIEEARIKGKFLNETAYPCMNLWSLLLLLPPPPTKQNQMKKTPNISPVKEKLISWKWKDMTNHPVIRHSVIEYLLSIYSFLRYQ